MDREISKSELKKEKNKKIFVISGAVAGFLLIIIMFRGCLTPSLQQARIRTAVAEIGDVEATINGRGVVVPEFEQVVISPIKSKILKVNLKAGENVSEGESILTLYRETIQNEYNVMLDEYELIKNRIEKKKLTVSRTLKELQTQFEIQKLKIKEFESDLEREKKLLEIGASTEVNVSKAKLRLEISKRELKLQEAQIQNQRKSLEADLKELEIETQIKERKVTELKRKLDDSFIKAENNGVVTMVNDEIGTNVNPGDIVAKVADLNSYKIECEISDIHGEKLFVNQNVKIRINNKDLPGIVKNISPAVTGSLVKFEVELKNNHHKLLRPNLRVEVFVIIGNKQKVVRVKNGPFYNASSNQKIYKVVDNKAVRIDAEFGASNFDFVEIVSGIEPGDKVIITNMEEYYSIDEIEIN